MPIYAVPVEKRMYVKGTVAVVAENEDAAYQKVEERLTSGSLQTTHVDWDAPVYEDDTFNVVYPE